MLARVCDALPPWRGASTDVRCAPFGYRSTAASKTRNQGGSASETRADNILHASSK